MGFETYTQVELEEMIGRIEFDLRQERWAADGDGLRAEIARANVRHFEKQIRDMRLVLNDKRNRHSFPCTHAE